VAYIKGETCLPNSCYDDKIMMMGMMMTGLGSLVVIVVVAA
jgi:hypothetical protein